VGEGDDGTSGPSEEAQRSATYWTHTALVGEVEAFEVGGVDAGVERGIVVLKVPMPACITRAVTGSGEVAGMGGLSTAV